MLKKATVKLDGLTLIAGENDTGKSTVGKVFFCIIKAISKYKDLKESKEDKIEDILDELFFIARRNLQDEDRSRHIALRNIFHIRKYVQIGEKNPAEYMKKIRLETDNLSIKKHRDIIKELVYQLELTINTPEDVQKSVQNALKKVLHSEFNSSILKYGEEEGRIKLSEKELLLLDISIDSQNTIKLKNQVEPIEFKDATFIESPLILNNHDLLSRSRSGLDLTKRRSRMLGVPYTTLHTKDLFDKLKFFDFNFEDKFLTNVLNDIQNIIDGEIIYDEDEKDFVYIKGKQKIPIKNTATGIKVFGIIQLLINNEFINKTGILILDEPENHLHPKWQLKYAQIIAILVKNNISVIANSHSPYMIEALKRYSDKEGIENSSNFYLANDGAIEDKSNLQKIYEKLSEPYDEFDKMDSDILNGK